MQTPIKQKIAKVYIPERDYNKLQAKLRAKGIEYLKKKGYKYANSY
jgi:hypothetical protein